ncbi:MAG: hypothetical protein HYZ74_07580 [Elusimicrobia bacterium]|nr:hypothetical protein [Elusimicrobiota bacterium]
MKEVLFCAVLLAAFACAHAGDTPASAVVPPRQASAPSAIRLSDEEALSVGKKIWQNECSGTVDGLTHWNKGEAFASLGIGHFIWYPAGTTGPFTESFPGLLKALQSSGVALPDWLKGNPSCPWPDKEAFFADFRGPRLTELRGILAGTVAVQARYAADRLQDALPKILAAAPEADRPALRARFDRVAAAANGVYALMDYVNFKGEGTSPTERYKGQGWGLLQVLEGMADAAPGQPSVEAFAQSADAALTRRAANCPPERNDAFWLPNWRRRLGTYLEK